MADRKNFPSRVSKRREGALKRLKLDAHADNETDKKRTERLKKEIEILEAKLGKV